MSSPETLALFFQNVLLPRLMSYNSAYAFDRSLVLLKAPEKPLLSFCVYLQVGMSWH
jgi:hypothetical protein